MCVVTTGVVVWVERWCIFDRKLTKLFCQNCILLIYNNIFNKDDSRHQKQPPPSVASSVAFSPIVMPRKEEMGQTATSGKSSRYKAWLANASTGKTIGNKGSMRMLPMVAAPSSKAHSTHGTKLPNTARTLRTTA